MTRPGLQLGWQPSPPAAWGQAAAIARDVGLVPRALSGPQTAVPGTVVRADPASGTRLELGSVVTLVVSSGSEQGEDRPTAPTQRVDDHETTPVSAPQQSGDVGKGRDKSKGKPRKRKP